MITIFKNKKDIPLNKEYIELNDIFLIKIRQQNWMIGQRSMFNDRRFGTPQ